MVYEIGTRRRVVVVGGGTAGCVVAVRLSEDPTCEVLVLEAGTDYRGLGETPPEVLDAKYVPMRGHAPQANPEHDWGITVDVDGTPIVVPQAKLIGGGSAINGAIALRGATADYQEWVDAGNPRWNRESVWNTFDKLESDPAAGVDGGRYPITRATDDELGPLQQAFVDSARAVGAPVVDDFNAGDVEGVGPVPQSRQGAIRMSTALVYLDPVRHRPNLVVRGGVEVSRILLRDATVLGVELADGSHIDADEVILCAGAIATPAILQRSGIGPRALLEPLGIEVVADLPVGANLADHCVVPLLAVPKPGAWQPDDFSLQTAWRYSSEAQPSSLDSQLTMFSYLDARTNDSGGRGMAGRRLEGVANVAGIGCVLNKPRSTGRVAITSSALTSRANVEPHYLSNQIDIAVMKQIVRNGWKVLTTSPLADLLDEPIGVSRSVIEDDGELQRFIVGSVASGYHFTGTARMAARNRGGVVDQSGDIYGVANLRVIDASILPTIPAANPMLAVIMAAEHIVGHGRS